VWASDAMKQLLGRIYRASITRLDSVIDSAIRANNDEKISTEETSTGSTKPQYDKDNKNEYLRVLNRRIKVYECSRWFDVRATQGMNTQQVRALRVSYARHLLIPRGQQQQYQHESIDSLLAADIERIIRENTNNHGHIEECVCAADAEVVTNFTKFAFRTSNKDAAKKTKNSFSNNVRNDKEIAYGAIANLDEQSYNTYDCAYRRATGTSQYLEHSLSEVNMDTFSPIFSSHRKSAGNDLLNRLHTRSLALDETPMDMFLYGSCSPKRAAFVNLAAVHELLSGTTSRALCVGGWPTVLFDAELQQLIMLSRVIINIHSHNDSSTQIHRLQYLFSLGKCVVSEASHIDAVLDAQIAPAVLFAESNQEIIDIADVIAHDR
jgi:hypothetical protein